MEQRLVINSCPIVHLGTVIHFSINSRNVFVCFLNFSLVLCDLFLSVLEDNLKEIAYDAIVAGLRCVR